MSLPGELRNHIYTYLVPSFPSEIKPMRDHLPIQLVGSPGRHQFLAGLPGIAYVNKQIYTELVLLVMQETKFVLESGADLQYFKAILSALPPSAWHRVRKLVCPMFSTSPQRPNVHVLELGFIRPFHALQDLSITLDTDFLRAVSSEYIVHPTSTTQSAADVGINVERLAGKWGLSTFHRFPHLQRLRMQCRVLSGQAIYIGVFKALAEWVMANWSYAISNELKGVNKRQVQFTGKEGHCDLVVFVFSVERIKIV
ncbi:hypothetical protein BKA66DRAFT_571785 [Pyrenochaeta sp. MPI-SDFR-AT-0127]|nr:hypothetical protein BKA66DRAFT_571785 [Pyrenochaeta sp. MPI-SDFR-AT-0127]